VFEDTKGDPKIKEGQTTQWPNEKGQKNKQWSTKLILNAVARYRTQPIHDDNDSINTCGFLSTFCENRTK